VNGVAAVRYCEDVTRSRARNFWYGIRLLPEPKRQALASVYAMARRIDDVGDGDLAVADKRAALDEIGASIAHVSPGSDDPVLAALGIAAVRFPLPLDAFTDLVDGVRLDLDDHAYRTWNDLELYCRRVAGSIGRLSLGVFGSRDPEADAVLADDLGVAMQLTNVLRDVREDLDRDRVYLPQEDLERFGVARDHLAGGGDVGGNAGNGGNDRNGAPGAVSLIRFEVGRAREWFDRGLTLLPRLDRRSAACAGAMAGIYRRLLDRIDADPTAVLSRRISLPPWEKAWVATRAIAGATP
jgi:15-cis-phytoene synthase